MTTNNDLKRFPIQDGPSVPWDYMEPFLRLCERNHGGQTLQRIAVRGGLSAAEAEILVTGTDFYKVCRSPEDAARLRAAWFERAERVNREWCQGFGKGVFLIAKERERQQTEEGWIPEHDDCHERGELANAAACYAATHEARCDFLARLWPFTREWWKPTYRIRELAKAGALIAAEIDRLVRLESHNRTSGN